MPVIRITDATWDRLKRWAVPLEDTPEDAVRKVLDAAEEKLRFRQPLSAVQPKTSKRRHVGEKLPRGMKTPQDAYRRPILETLRELGGSAPVNDVLDLVEKKMKPLLTEADYQKLRSGADIRWRNTAQWERFEMVKDGLLKSESPTGIWELTERGASKVQKSETVKVR